MDTKINAALSELYQECLCRPDDVTSRLIVSLVDEIWKKDGQVDILCRTIAGEDEADLAIDYGGMGYETEPRMLAARQRIHQLQGKNYGTDQGRTESQDAGSTDEVQYQQGLLPEPESSGQDEVTCGCRAWVRETGKHFASCKYHRHEFTLTATGERRCYCGANFLDAYIGHVHEWFKRNHAEFCGCGATRGLWHQAPSGLGISGVPRQ